MTNSINTLNITAEVRAFLKTALPNADISDASVNPDYQPLLFIKTNHILAAFAFANGDMHKSYETLYGCFKEFYTKQQDQWDDLDLAFVFCVAPSVQQLDQFCSLIETDVYFCRKFVIPIIPPLEKSLARLPFLPLSSVQGRSLRPASAQTFLQQCGVSAKLSKFIVQQGQRSPERIIDDCINGEFGEPYRPTVNNNEVVIKSENLTDTIRLETIEIQNFRAYRKKQIFEFGEDVTVLYGPNGFGKTSFFDAIDFAATGEIGRIKYDSQSDFTKMARHLDGGNDESFVALTFRLNDIVSKVSRNTDNWSNALLDGERTDRKGILAKLTIGNIPATDRVENFVKLFRATHLFSQEHQELASDFQINCQLSSEIVSRMLAFEDYANAVSKSSKILKHVKNNVESLNKQINDLNERISAETKELDRLGQSAKKHTNLNFLDVELASLREKLETIGIVVTPTIPDIEIIRSWRAESQLRYSQAQSKIDRLSSLAKEVSSLPQARKELEAIQKELTHKELKYKAFQENRITSEIEIQSAEQLLSKMTAKRVDSQARADLLEWVRITQPEYIRLVEYQLELSTELKNITETLDQLNQTKDKAVSELRSQEAIVKDTSEKLKINQEKMEEVHAFREAVIQWQLNKKRLAEVLQLEQSHINSMENQRVEAQELIAQLSEVNRKEGMLARHISEVDKNHSELRSIIFKLQSHVHIGECPLCGEDYGSKDKLFQQIQKHVAADTASEVRAELTSVREHAKQLSEWIVDNKQKQQFVEDQLSKLKNEQSMLKTEIDYFMRSAFVLGIEVSEIDAKPFDQSIEIATRLSQEVATLNNLFKEVTFSAEIACLAVENSKKAIATKESEAVERKTALVRVEEKIALLRSDQRLTDVSLEIEPSKLDDLEKLNLKNITEFKTESAKAEAEVNKKKLEMSILLKEAKTLQERITNLRKQESYTQTTVKLTTFKLLDLGLPEETSEHTIHALIEDETRIQAQVLDIRDATSTFEMLMDASTTAAALTTIQQRVKSLENELDQAKTKLERHLPWMKYFQDIFRIVSLKQNESINKFTKEYGPRTSVIQRRLRTVYGFDEIEIRSHESKIDVRVLRHGEELRPTNYFSQSQQQTLLLGLFLTACSSQTWSAFSPVFLDDPVTHFDDLNTYAFLDLLVGLIESEVEKRQFIISTCDEKLFQLARQKFRHLGKRAKYYRFTSIGTYGPNIVSL